MIDKIIMDPPKYPEHWGRPPLKQTRDLVPLPAGFGKGSSTLLKWITDKMNEDSKTNHPNKIVVNRDHFFSSPEFPDCVSKNGEQAKELILMVNSQLEVEVLAEGSIVTEDYRTDRVRIFVDKDGNVTKQPQKG
eukprot:CAMPEP_0194201190 /NCGR_PEP_ID=MMETSP0156-20130528/1527_1 /TAXON_ID=33649 /ORGANISM="Thalassionema nitzschioides, Strain L26-B" /LENGTH=133 /DNA_ID=CAMNT_0038926321 /DNA_START=1 /DNA_END=402 /DNA_ORIENTATION=-